jgi:hypothetical protein
VLRLDSRFAVKRALGTRSTIENPTSYHPPTMHGDATLLETARHEEQIEAIPLHTAFPRPAISTWKRIVDANTPSFKDAYEPNIRRVESLLLRGSGTPLVSRDYAENGMVCS